MLAQSRALKVLVQSPGKIKPGTIRTDPAWADQAESRHCRGGSPARSNMPVLAIKASGRGSNQRQTFSTTIQELVSNIVAGSSGQTDGYNYCNNKPAILPRAETRRFTRLISMKTENYWKDINRFHERGEGLIQVLVAIAIIASIAASISSVIVGSRDKSVATQLCNAVREIQDAKARYLMDNPAISDTSAASFAVLEPYLTAMGVPVTGENQLLAGTGRTVTDYGTFSSGVTIDKHVDLTHISADMQPIVQMITFADGGG